MVVNIANLVVMGHITKSATVEHNGYMEYDLTYQTTNAGGSVNHCRSCTITIKVPRSQTFHSLHSNDRVRFSLWTSIKVIEQLQIKCKIDDPPQIPLHSNIGGVSLQSPIFV